MNTSIEQPLKETKPRKRHPPVSHERKGTVAVKGETVIRYAGVSKSGILVHLWHGQFATENNGWVSTGEHKRIAKETGLDVDTVGRAHRELQETTPPLLTKLKGGSGKKKERWASTYQVFGFGFPPKPASTPQSHPTK